MKPNSPLYASGLVFLLLIVFAPNPVSAQGTLYVSTLATGGRFSDAGVASDSWIAQEIETGDNPSGYVVNSVELAVAGAGLVVSLYSAANNLPATDLGNFTGPSGSMNGIYTYNASGFTLPPSTEYFIVATAPISLPATYSWTAGAGSSATGTDQWMIGPSSLQSSDQGADWTTAQGVGDLQMAIYATPVPETSTWILCLLGGGFAFYVHARKRLSSQAKLD